MRHLFLLILIMTAYKGKAQSHDSAHCSKFIKIVTDKVTGSTNTSLSKAIILKKPTDSKKLIIDVLKLGKGEILLNMVISGVSGCVDEASGINILFRDGSRMTLINEFEYNCRGWSWVYFGGKHGKETEAIKLSENEIEIIRVWTEQSFVEQTLNTSQSKSLQQGIKCLLN